MKRMFPVYQCCDHCVAEEDGKCWAARIGHGAYCLECQTPTANPAPNGDPA